MDQHKFTPATGARTKCDVCGKTRNAQAHRGASKAAEPAQKPVESPAPVTRDEPTVRMWVGWRIAHAAILRVNDSSPSVASLARKLHERKPDSVLDRYVDLTQAECDALDNIAMGFQEPGNGGPAVYSASTLRKRIRAAWNQG
jgi:hypothetical protein